MSNFEGGQASVPARTAVQKSFGSTVYLGAAIVFAVSLILDLATAQANLDIVNDILEAFNGRSTSILSGGMGGIIIARLPKILALAGMLLAWNAAKNMESKSGTGFTLLQVATCLTYIPMMLLIGLGALVLVAAGREVFANNFGEEAEAAVMRIAVGLFVAMILSLVYMIGLMKTYGSCGKVVKTLDGWKGASVVVIVINVISIIGRVFGILLLGIMVKDVLAPYIERMGLDPEPIEKLFTGVSAMPGILTAVYLILLTMTFIKANSEYKKNAKTL